jgi:hypothetical protein
MENGMWAIEDYKSYTTKYGLMKVCKETYGPPIS